MSIFSKIFGDANEKYLKRLSPVIVRINSLEKEFEKIPTERLKEKTNDLKARLKKGEKLDDILSEAFALVREAAKRTLGQRHYDCQLMGGIVLYEGKIAEMKTGEGKTLAATLPLYLNALAGKGCHLVTVNDYLARRDTVWMGQIYQLLGISVACLNHEQSFLYDPNYKKLPEEKEKQRDELGGFYVVEDFLRPCKRKEAYLADITYGTNNEFGFDYLRDNMVFDSNDCVQREFNYAIVDEVDSILIDEARTPLIISAPSEEKSEEYYRFALALEKLKKEDDYILEEKRRTAEWTEEGQQKVIKILGKDPWAEGDFYTVHKLENARSAKEFFILNQEYVIKNGEIVIVDEFTGRLMPGRRWSGGLHQAVEAKEHISGHPEVAVKSESVTLATITFQNLFRKYKKLAGMTGTALTSAEEFDRVYGLEVLIIPTNKPMVRKELPDRIYKTLNGKYKAIVEEIKERYTKGQPVLVGTRSVEKNEYLGILLDREGIVHQVLNAKQHEKEGQIIAQAGKLGQVTIATNMAGRGVDIILGGNPPDSNEAKIIREVGGLHIIGTERHEARRIDNQLRGRSGRQGDPGSSQFFLSLEDDLMRIFGGEKIKSLMNLLKIPETEPIEAKLVSRSIEEAQSKIEGFNFDLRKNLLEYDDVMNKHREAVYRKRKEILMATTDVLKENILQTAEKYGFSKKDYEKKETEVSKDDMEKLIRFVSLKTIDMLWISHLEIMDYIKDSVQLRAYGQRDPLVEYKTEAHKIFQKLLTDIDLNTINTIFKMRITTRISKLSSSIKNDDSKDRKKVGRNDPCPCGSGKKYKQCCWPTYG